MALVPIPPFAMPMSPLNSFNAGQALLMDATGEAVAHAFRAAKTGNIAKVHFRTVNVTTGDTILGSLQDLDPATGFPDGVADQSGTVVVASSDDNVWKTVTFGAVRAVTVGDPLAFVSDWNSYVAGNLEIACGQSAIEMFSYPLLKTAGVWSKQSRASAIAIEYDDGKTYFNYGVSACVATNTDYASNTAGADEYGNYFQPQVTCQVVALGWNGRHGGDCDLVLYDTDGTTVLRSVSLDKDLDQAVTSGLERIAFVSPVTLTAGSWYRVTVKPTTTTTIRALLFDHRATSDMDQTYGDGMGQKCVLTKRVDAGAWTEVSTSRCSTFVLVNAIDTGSGSSNYFYSVE